MTVIIITESKTWFSTSFFTFQGNSHRRATARTCC